MSTLRQEKFKELLRELAAQFLQTESNYTSLITVTDVNISSDLKRSTVFVTVFPENSEASAMDFLKRKRRDFKKFVKTKAKLKFIPFFDFEIDKGEKNRQRIDELLKSDSQ